MKPLRLGCVPYLNAKPIIDWFHSEDCIEETKVSYVVPSQLAVGLERGEYDAALVSIFEWFRRPELILIPGVSISAHGPVLSVRLFSKVPIERIKSVALDTSSLTSVALTQIILSQCYGVTPEYLHRPPDLYSMLQECDAGLIIGDLQLFDSHKLFERDLGYEWLQLTGLPFCYAAWLARPEADHRRLERALNQARAWGVARLSELTTTWAERMRLPVDRVEEYLVRVMQYDLGADKVEAIERFRKECDRMDLIQCAPLTECALAFAR